LTRSGNGEPIAGMPLDKGNEALSTAPIWGEDHQSLQSAKLFATYSPVQHPEAAIQPESAASGASALLHEPHANLFNSCHKNSPPLPSHLDPLSHDASAPGSSSESGAALTRGMCGMREWSGGDRYPMYPMYPMHPMSVDLPSTRNLQGGSRIGRGADITEYLHNSTSESMKQDAAYSLHHLHMPPGKPLSVQREMQTRQSFQQQTVDPSIHHSWFNTQQGMHQTTHEAMMPPPDMLPYHIHQIFPDYRHTSSSDIHQSAATRPAMGDYACHQQNQMGAPSLSTFSRTHMATRQQGDDAGADSLRAPRLSPATPGMSGNFPPVVAYNVDSYNNTSHNISTGVSINSMTNRMHMQLVGGSQQVSTPEGTSILEHDVEAFAHGR